MARFAFYGHPQKHAKNHHNPSSSITNGWHNGWHTCALCYARAAPMIVGPDHSVTNEADALRVERGCDIFLGLLVWDPRVMQAYTKWCQLHEVDARVSSVRSAESAAATFASPYTERALESAVHEFGLAILAEHPDDKPLFAWLVRELKLSRHFEHETSAAILARLLAQFRVWAMDDARGRGGAPFMRMGLAPTRRSSIRWAKSGRRPKREGPKGHRLEDLERKILTFYCCEVQPDPMSKKGLAKLQGRLRSDVQHDCKAARELLAFVRFRAL